MARPIKLEFLGDTKGVDESVGHVNSALGKLGAGAKAAAGAAGVAAGGALAMGLNASLDIGTAQAKLKAQLGGSGPFAAEMGAIAGNLYANAYGENLGQVNEAVKSVVQSGALMEDATNEQIESITGKAMSLAQAFDLDVTESMRAVGQLVRTDMVPTAEAGLDLITRAFQEFGPQSHDVLDTVTEYSTQFRKLGLDGPTAMGLVGQAVKAGARDTDVAADAIKEFSIRAIDGSKASEDAFHALGLNAQQMAAQIAKGGPEAAAGLQTVLDQLRAMENPVEQSKAAFGLFGTQAEDLGAALFAMDPSRATVQLGELAGAAAEADRVLGDTTQNGIIKMVRGFEMFAASAFAATGPVGDVAAGVASIVPSGLDIVGNLGMIAVAMRGVGIAGITSSVGLRTFWTALTGPVGITIGVILGLTTLVIANWDTIKNVTGAAWDWVGSKIGGTIDWVRGVVSGGVDFVRGTISWFGNLPGMVGGWFGGMANAAGARINDLIGWVTGIPGRAANALGNLGSLLWNSGTALVSGFWDGIVSRWNQLIGWLQSGIKRVRDLFPFSPAKEGPFSGRGYVTFSGEALTSDFAKSLRAGIPGIVASARSVVHAAQGGLSSASLAPLAPLAAVTSAPAGGGAAGPVELVIRGDGSGISQALVELTRK